MKFLATLSLTLTVLLGNIKLSWALPECKGSPLFVTADLDSLDNVKSWSDCRGRYVLTEAPDSTEDYSDGRIIFQIIARFTAGEADSGRYEFFSPHEQAGRQYEGQLRNFKPHGRGTLTFKSPHKFAGEKYVGEFKNGIFHGQGTTTVSAPSKHAGVRYVGGYKDGKQHGWGTLTSGPPHLKAGTKYVGEWKAGKPHGQGTRTNADGQIQEGIWEAGIFQYAQRPDPPKKANSIPDTETRTLQRELASLKRQDQEKTERFQRENARLKREEREKLEALQKEIARLKEEKRQTSLRKSEKRRNEPKSVTSGSGFFVSKLGHVVTNEHVIRNCRTVTVGDNADKQVAASVLEADRRNDLALLRISSTRAASAETRSLISKLGVKKLGIRVVPLASGGLMRSEDIELGEKVLVAGFPFGEFYSDTIKVTGGMVSAVRGMGDDSAQFQIDAAVQPGNSGGPIYDENGNIVGVVVAQLNKLKVAKVTGSLPENVNFGIKASTVRQFLISAGLPTKWSNRTEQKTTRELAKIATKQTVMVQCHQ